MNSANANLDEARGGKVSYHHFVHTFDDLVPREPRQALIDGLERAVELRVGHRVEEARVPRGHLGAEDGKVLAPAPDFSGVEGGGGLGRGVAGRQRQEGRRRDGQSYRESV